MKKGISLLLMAISLSSCDLNWLQGGGVPFNDDQNNNPPKTDIIDDDEGKTDIETEGDKDNKDDDEKDPPIVPPQVIKVTQFNIDSESLVLGVSTSYRLNYTILPQNAENKTIAWSTDDAKICKVDSYGTLTCIRVGETVIRGVTTDGSNITSECKVTVTNISVTDVTVSESNVFLLDAAQVNRA